MTDRSHGPLQRTYRVANILQPQHADQSKYNRDVSAKQWRGCGSLNLMPKDSPSMELPKKKNPPPVKGYNQVWVMYCPQVYRDVAFH